MGNEIKNTNNLTWHDGYRTREERETLHGHKAAAIWFTGLSASGKSTIAQHLEKILFDAGCSTYVFDGDNVRHGLCRDLGFSAEDRCENIRRIGEMVKLFVDAGIIAMTAFISPYRRDREGVRDLVGKDRFFEVFVDCPADVCADRDPKGIYAKAKEGIIKNFTGISAPYECPESPSLTIKSDRTTPIEAAMQVVDMLRKAIIIP